MVLGEKLSEKREIVLSLYKRYKKLKSEFKEIVHENDGIDDDFFEKRRVENIKKGKFIIAVTGKVKAGKSTFINALIGKEVLPCDVVQATSAVVEIYKSDKSFLEIKFADGHTEKVEDDLSSTYIDEVKERLTRYCKILDEYRDIPITLIEDIIINSNSEPVVDDNFIEVLEEKSKLKNLKEKKDKILQYIKEHPKDKIPVEIVFGYPVPWNVDEIRICDTPGVKAIGGVQNRTYDFLINADAILFIHPIKPIESEDLKDLIEKQIPNYAKENIFLILTHAGKETDEDRERLLKTAKEYYRNLIQEEKIFAVDSIIKLIYDDLKNGKSIEDKEVDEKMNIVSGAAIKKISKTKDINELLSYSGFKDLYEVLDGFLSKAPYRQILEVVEKIKEGYEQQLKIFEQTKSLLRKQITKHPQSFAEEIDKIKRELEDYLTIYKTTIPTKQGEARKKIANFSDNLNDLRETYEKHIDKSSNRESVRKHLTDFGYEVDNKLKKFQSEIKTLLEEVTKKIETEFEQKTDIILPKIDFEKIVYEAEEISMEEYMKKSFWGKLWDRIKSIFVNTELKKIQGLCKNEMIDYINGITKKIEKYVEEIFTNAMKETDIAIKNRQKRLEELKKEEFDTRETLKKIDYIEKKQKEIEDEKNFCENLKEEIKCLLT